MKSADVGCRRGRAMWQRAPKGQDFPKSNVMNIIIWWPRSEISIAGWTRGIENGLLFELYNRLLKYIYIYIYIYNTCLKKNPN